MNGTNPHRAVTLRVVIVDDEALARRGVAQLLEKHDDCRVVAECRNAREGFKAIREARPDLVFLDIQLPRTDAFALLDSLEPGTAPAIVFLTAHDEHALRAFEHHAFDYLLKPASQERFDTALDRVRQHLAGRQAVAVTRQLADIMEGPAPRQTLGGCLVVPTPAGNLVLDTSDIDWIQARDYCSIVHCDRRRHVIRESLRALENKLSAEEFVRVHRSAIIRVDRIRELLRTRGGDDRGGGTIVLRDGSRVPVSRRRRGHVLAILRRQAQTSSGSASPETRGVSG